MIKEDLLKVRVYGRRRKMTVKTVEIGDLGKPIDNRKEVINVKKDTTISKPLEQTKADIKEDVKLSEKKDITKNAVKGKLLMTVFTNAPIKTEFSGMLSGADIRVMRVALRRGYLQWNAEKFRKGG